MQKLKNIFDKSGINKTNVKDIEKELGFGLDVETLPKSSKNKETIEINESLKRVFMDVRIKSKKEMILKCGKTNDCIRCLMPKNVGKKFAITNGEFYYSEEFGKSSSSPPDHYVYEVKAEDLEHEFKTRIANLTEVCKIFNVDAGQYMYNEKVLTRVLLYQNVKYLQGTEHVTDEEDKFLSGAFVGALNYADKERVIRDSYGYDINSFYPYVMSQTDFKFPLLEGEIKTTKKSYPIEIKRLRIKGVHKYWRNSPDDYYDSYQVELLKLLKIPYEELDEPKLCYSEVVKGSSIFSYFEDIYEMKKNGNKHAKLILNSCAGQLSRRKEYEIEANNLEDSDIEKVIDYNERRNIFLLRDGRAFKFVFGRIKTLLHSYVRLCLVRDYVLPLEEKGYEIYQIKTDSLVTDAKPESINLGKEMGDLKLEKEFSGVWRVKNKKVIICEN